MGTTLDSVANSGTRKGRPNYSPEFKQQIVAAASMPGASVSQVAMSHRLNANMVFRWRRELTAGTAGSNERPTTLMPIVLERDQAAAAPIANAVQFIPGECKVEVMIGGACVHISGTPDPAVLRAVFQSLRP
jgi:transposase